MAPDLHDEAVGQQLDQSPLIAGIHTADRHVASLIHIVNGASYDLLRGEESVVIFNGSFNVPFFIFINIIILLL